MSTVKSKISALMLVSAITVALCMTIATHLVLNQVGEEALRQARQQQERSLATLWEVLNAKGRGLRIHEGALWAGNYRVNGNHEVPDRVFSITGSRATIFMHDVRVSTSVMLEDGQRAEGTHLTGPAFDSIFREGTPYRGEVKILGVPYLAAYDPVRDAGGEVIGAVFVGVKKDEYLAGLKGMSLRIKAINGALTAFLVLGGFALLYQRKRSEAAIQKQLNFLRVLADTIPIPIFYKDLQHRYSGCNRAMETFTGACAEELIGKTVEEFWPGHSERRCRELDRELMERPGYKSYESRVLHADGSERDVILYKATFLDHDGRPGGLVGALLDISERKRAEQDLEEAYRRTADILEFLPDGVMVVDREQRVIAWNRAMEEMTGISKDQMLGKGNLHYSLPFYGNRQELLIDLLDAEEEEIAARYQNGRRIGKTIFGDMRIENYRGGETRILRGAATPLFDRQGVRTGGIETIRDITDLRKTALQKSRLEAQLHHSRMSELLMVQLSHDLKTPLTPLFALLPLVAREVSDPKLSRMLEICGKSAGQIQGLAEKSLHLVRLSSPGLSPEPVPVQLAESADLVVEQVAFELAERRVSCYNLIPHGLQVLVARDQLELLLRNLLSNAARFGCEGGSVRIGARESGGTVTVSVQDDGIGLEPEHTSLIFGEFFKADSARHDLDGQGLGLAICQKIVLNHGGSIWAESPGKGLGSTIFFTLDAPAAGAQGQDPSKKAQEEPT